MRYLRYELLFLREKTFLYNHYTLSMIRDEDFDLLLNDILEQHGYDFTSYSRDSLKRRVHRLYMLDKFYSFEELRNKIRSEDEYISRFVNKVTVNVTEMFRDSSFYKEMRKEIIPALADLPEIKIWHAGCSSGQEVYSMAILLHEAGLLKKSLIYATDINVDMIKKAKTGIFPRRHIKLYSENYAAAGGTQNFAAYYSVNEGEMATFHREFGERVFFSTHNLVSDRSFSKFHLIVCRNVLIYFDRMLQEKVLGLFHASLNPSSYLALGAKETLRFSSIAPKFEKTGKEKIWRKIQ